MDASKPGYPSFPTKFDIVPEMHAEDSPLDSSVLHSFTLTFRDKEIEKEFTRSIARKVVPMFKKQAVFANVVFLLSSGVDHLIVPASRLVHAYIIRCVFVTVFFSMTYSLTFRNFLKTAIEHHQLFMTVAAIGYSMCGMFIYSNGPSSWGIPFNNASSDSPNIWGPLLTSVAMSALGNFLAFQLRFINAIVASVSLLAMFNIFLCCMYLPVGYPHPNILIFANFCVVIAGFTSAVPSWRWEYILRETFYKSRVLKNGVSASSTSLSALRTTIQKLDAQLRRHFQGISAGLDALSSTNTVASDPSEALFAQRATTLCTQGFLETVSCLDNFMKLRELEDGITAPSIEESSREDQQAKPHLNMNHVIELVAKAAKDSCKFNCSMKLLTSVPPCLNLYGNASLVQQTVYQLVIWSLRYPECRTLSVLVDTEFQSSKPSSPSSSLSAMVNDAFRMRRPSPDSSSSPLSSSFSSLDPSQIVISPPVSSSTDSSIKVFITIALSSLGIDACFPCSALFSSSNESKFQRIQLQNMSICANDMSLALASKLSSLWNASIDCILDRAPNSIIAFQITASFSCPERTISAVDEMKFNLNSFNSMMRPAPSSSSGAWPSPTPSPSLSRNSSGNNLRNSSTSSASSSPSSPSPSVSRSSSGNNLHNTRKPHVILLSSDRFFCSTIRRLLYAWGFECLLLTSLADFAEEIATSFKSVKNSSNNAASGAAASAPSYSRRFDLYCAIVVDSSVGNSQSMRAGSSTVQNIFNHEVWDSIPSTLSRFLLFSNPKESTIGLESLCSTYHVSSFFTTPLHLHSLRERLCAALSLQQLALAGLQPASSGPSEDIEAFEASPPASPFSTSPPTSPVIGPMLSASSLFFQSTASSAASSPRSAAATLPPLLPPVRLNVPISIVIFDQDKVSASLFSLHLHRHGHSVTLARSWADLIQLTEQHKFNFALLCVDAMLALQEAQYLRSEESSSNRVSILLQRLLRSSMHRSLSIVLLSSNSIVALEDELSAGNVPSPCIDIWKKPLKLNQLDAAVARVQRLMIS